MDALVSDANFRLRWAWLDSAGIDPQEDWELLSADEVTRARRFVRAVDARRFIAARAILRRLLGSYLGDDPRALSFEYALCFSVAHSAGAARFAFVRGRRVGVDLELIREPTLLDVARQFFAVDEFEALVSVGAAERAPALYRCRTQKEAYQKAKGIGLSATLGAFAVSVAPGPPYPLAWSRLDPEDVGRCEVGDWEPRLAHIVATGCP